MIHNEKVKLLAVTLNNLGIATIVIGFLTPTVNSPYGTLGLELRGTTIALTTWWVTSGVLLLVAARHCLEGLKE